MSDGDGGMWIAGTTESPDFPVTAGALQGSLNRPANPLRGSNADLFLARLDGRTGFPTFATYLGADEPFGSVVGDKATVGHCVGEK